MPGNKAEKEDGLSEGKVSRFSRLKKTWNNVTDKINKTQPWDYSLMPLKGSHETRFIELFAGAEHDDLNIDLLAADVQKKHHFGALSYCWGDPAMVCSVFIGTYPRYEVKITRSLDSALRHVRKMIKPKQSIIFWVDAVCINQKDNEEKARQIPLMPLIYPVAFTTYCWLGNSDSTTETAMNYFRDFGSAALRDDQSTTQRLATQLINEARSDRRPTIDAIRRMMEREWFERAWCLQEGCRPLDDMPFIMCGDHNISFLLIMKTIEALFSYLSAEDRLIVIGERHLTTLSMLMIASAPREQLKLSTLLKAVATRKATVSRDKIYALLGLLPDVSALPPPNYKISEPDVCTSYTRAIIEQEQRLLILQGLDPDAKSAPNDADLPSWSISLSSLSGSLGIEDTSLTAGSARPLRYCASGSSKPQLLNEQGTASRSLGLRGQALDKIHHVRSISSVIARLEAEVSGWSDLIQVLNNVASELDLPTGSGYPGETLSTALARTLTRDLFYTSASVSQPSNAFEALVVEYRRQFMASNGEQASDKTASSNSTTPSLSHQELVTWCKQHLLFEEGLRVESEKTPLNPGVSIEWLEQQVVRAFIKWCRRGTSLFTTAAGRLGIALSHVQQQDDLFLFPGSTTPLILRSNATSPTGGWVYRGEAYLHGVMYGEAYDESSLQDCVIY